MNQEQKDFVDNLLENSNSLSFNFTWKQIKKDNPLNIKQKELKEYLATFDYNQINKKNLVNNPFLPHRALQEFQIDITYITGVDYEDPAPGGMKIWQRSDPKNIHLYALTCIDVFTKFAWLVIMKNKDSKTTLEALKKIIAKMGKPESIYSDDGSEFKNKLIQKFCDENKIELIFNITHAPFIERWHRTLREMLNAYFKPSESKLLTPDVLFGKNGIITEYNNKVEHGVTEFTPAEAKKEENREKVRKNIVDKSRKFVKREEIQVGDKVRYFEKMKESDKGTEPKWSDDLFTVIKKEGRYFYLDGNPSRDKYLRHMLQKVTGEVKKFTKKPKDEGTKTKFMKDLSKAEVIPESILEAEKQKEKALADIGEKIKEIKAKVRKKNPKYQTD